MTPKAKIAICASGEGSNFAALVEASRRGELPAEIVGLIVNRPKIGAIGRAQRLGIPFKVISPKDFSSRADWDQSMALQLKRWKADWIVLAGFLALVGPEVLRAFAGHVVNSHPSLLPKYGGPGMYGDNVHAAVLSAKESETGVTVHLIDAKFDQGTVLAQGKVAIRPGDTLEQLAQRVKDFENEFYPRVVADLVAGRLTSKLTD